MVFYDNFITTQGVQNLAVYKYSSTGYTALDNILNPYWYKWVEYIPDTWAPNMITLCAALSCVIPTWLFVFIDPSFSGPYPTWLYVVAAVGVWFYQTLDALDGKQARRIGLASPLGQLLDHGCDSFAGVYLMLLIMSCGGLGEAIPAYGLIFLYILSFYFANWSEYFTHVSVTRVGDAGVTEIQWLAIAILLFTGFNETGFGSLEVGALIPIFPRDGKDGVMAWIGSCRLGMLLFYTVLASAPYNIWYTVNITKDKIKNQSYALMKLVPLLCILAVFLNWATIVNLHPYKGYVFVGIGVYNSLMICKFIVNGLAADDFSMFQWELLVPGVLGTVARLSDSTSMQLLCVGLMIASGMFLFCDFTFNVVGKIAGVVGIKNILSVPGEVTEKYRAKALVESLKNK